MTIRTHQLPICLNVTAPALATSGFPRRMSRLLGVNRKGCISASQFLEPAQSILACVCAGTLDVLSLTCVVTYQGSVGTVDISLPLGSVLWLWPLLKSHYNTGSFSFFFSFFLNQDHLLIGESKHFTILSEKIEAQSLQSVSIRLRQETGGPSSTKPLCPSSRGASV